MVDMAKPWKHPQTGTYYLRRQIPAAIRAAFGGQQLHKVALGTKDPKQAAVLFLQANAELEIRFDEARSRLKATGSPLPSSRDRAEELIGGYFNGPEHAPGALDGAGRLLLARLEIDRGLWNDTETGCSPVPASDAASWQALSDNAARFRNHPGTRRHLLDHAPGAIWRWGDENFRPGARQRQLERLVARVAYHHGVALNDLPPELAEVLTAYLDALPVGTITTRKARQTVGRLRPDLRLMELFDEWQLALAPSLQSAAEYRGAARDFIDLIGDIAVVEITNDDLLDFRDAISKLPAAMPKADRQLPFTKRVAKHEVTSDPSVTAKPRVGPNTVKKRVGGIQALLSFAHKQKWTKANVGRDVPVVGYSKRAAVPRQTFQESELQTLFSSPLFTEPANWSWANRTTDCSLYWLFLINGMAGARIEEVGQAMLSDVKSTGEITYIDVDDYTDDGPTEGGKSLKTATSRRLVPVPEAKLHWFEGSSHFPMWDMPEETVAVILSATG